MTTSPALTISESPTAGESAGTDTIEDMLITLGKQGHVIRPLESKPGLFVYLIPDKAKAELAMARHKTAELEKELAIQELRAASSIIWPGLRRAFLSLARPEAPARWRKNTRICQADDAVSRGSRT